MDQEPGLNHPMKNVNKTVLTVNGKPYQVLGADPKLHLNEWLRDHLHLQGTKVLCGEGGCGSCVVAIAKEDPVVHPESIQAINSCMCPILSLNGYHIVTVEGLGSQKDGFHVIQKRFAEKFASQCGYCTPGFIMNGFSLLASDPDGKTMKEIEDSFDGNICRCTGYRPIMDAMKSFAVECEEVEIEEIQKLKSCRYGCLQQKPKVLMNFADQPEAAKWIRPSRIFELLSILKSCKGYSLKFVGGNTGLGVFKNEPMFDVYIDMKNIAEMAIIQVKGRCLEIGGAVTLTSLVRFFEKNRKLSNSFDALAAHIKGVANVPVRNAATWAGNLMMKHAHPNFPSDISLIFEAAGARLTIFDHEGNVKVTEVNEFLKKSMKGKVIGSLILPFSKPKEVFRTYKIMPRKQNSYGYVIAGFRAIFDRKRHLFQSKPVICFDGMGLKAARMTNAEEFLNGKTLEDSETFQGALAIIGKSLEPNPERKYVDFYYCRNVAINLFYKFCVALRGERICKSIASATVNFRRPISSGEQTFHVNQQAAPLNQPYERIEAKLQSSGEVLFTCDLPKHPNEVHVSFLLSKKGCATLAGIDATEASQATGFIGLFTEKDIPGVNNFMFQNREGKIMTGNKIEYAGQILAVVAAESQKRAEEIVKMVKVEYKDAKKPVLTIEEAIDSQSFHPQRNDNLIIGNTEVAFEACDHIISGEIKSGAQHHFYIEPQNCLVIKEEHDYKVFSSSQCTRDVQSAVAKALDINAASVDVQVNRTGGAFGGKYQYPPMIASAVAVAAYHLNRPVRTFMNLEDNLKAIGKRPPMLSRYKVGFSREGYLQAIHVDIFCDTGCHANCEDAARARDYLENAYFCPNWTISVKECKTNTPFNTFFRGPGNIQSVLVIEEIMDHIAEFLGLQNAEHVKEINFYKNGQRGFAAIPFENCLLNDVWTEAKRASNFGKRSDDVTEFNKMHRWRKRGISIMPLKYDHRYLMNSNFSALVSIYYADGTIAISHGGIEMGQGIHTRVRTVAAAKLGIPLDYISVKPTSTITSANSFETGASITSEMNCVAVYKCCEILLKRIEPIRKLFPGATWKELIKECEKESIDLTAIFMCKDKEKEVYAYTTYGAASSMAEIDILTGEVQILRSDIVYDCGESINPRLDVGQVEGAFVQGMGYFLSEQVAYDPENGMQWTTNTWEYKPPMVKDIPIEMNVYLLHNSFNPLGFIRSKAVGEPAICMAASCLFAVKNAIKSARQEVDASKEYFCLNAPATIQQIQKLCLVNEDELKLAGKPNNNNNARLTCLNTCKL